METFVIADTHFEHVNILLYNNRPQLQPGDINPETGKWYDMEIARLRTEEMDEFLKDNWNNTVGKKDRVIIDGDFAFNRHAFWANSLNGKKILVLGSHDKASAEVYNNCFKEVVMRKTLVVKPHFFDINHCCQRIWERSHYGSIHLFGHSHGRLRTWNLSFDVGIDVPENNYRPVHIEEFIRRAEIRKEEMRQAGRIIIDKETKNGREYETEIFNSDDLVYFNKNARIINKNG